MEQEQTGQEAAGAVGETNAGAGESNAATGETSAPAPAPEDPAKPAKRGSKTAAKVAGAAVGVDQAAEGLGKVSPGPLQRVGAGVLSDASEEELLKRFEHHAPKGNQAERYTVLRGHAREFARLVCALCPDSRERSLALTHIEEAVFWGNGAIARNE